MGLNRPFTYLYTVLKYFIDKLLINTVTIHYGQEVIQNKHVNDAMLLLTLHKTSHLSSCQKT